MKRFRWLFALIGLAALAFGGFAAFKMMQPPPPGLDMAMSKASQAGHFIVAAAPENGPAQKGPLHNWIATLTTPDGKPVLGAKIAIDGGMPQHGHGLPTEPRMTGELGVGRYRIEGVKFNMGGWWVFRLSIEANGVQDTAEFNLVL